ncbi:cytochrome c oxidase subunit H [Coccomyxa subellipsoidea C-169]|uniref:Cytochrome c oxidase subunit H n=1 Tax=Coccomyxa subellipsoidea (strain C-169) TaxID=574566 RepID=I0YMB6_COCSC|nr:cytochrome c oxidase subunit H [Coccomyxa subellipsoidea C-169]EIE19535.1 cytochrome c oxidase subunit H [Coccomyxa subellipsoidea C-169]|eukprot:XP_005644079.1 cytochrome c oxidase subunit H [Coccomyxa subellipsoidea C-169]
MGNTVSYCEPSSKEELTADEPAAEEPAEEQESEEPAAVEEEEEAEPAPEIVVRTAPYDPRFPSTNQARNCYTRYNEFYKCAAEAGEDDDKCKFYQRAYRSICPGEWVERWNEARDAGNWPGKY